MGLFCNVFIAVVALSMLSMHVNADCDAVDQLKQSVTKERGPVADWFHDVGCSIKKGAQAVSDSVKDGYNYVKEKIAPEPTLEDRAKNYLN